MTESETSATRDERDAAAATVEAPVPAAGLGGRLRSLRLAAGLTQSELAGGRCSKEYVSQIERGKTRPTAVTIAWLAERLGVDARFLAHGVPVDEQARVDTVVARADALVELDRPGEALVELESIALAVRASGADELEVRWLLARERALTGLGDVRGSLETLQVARALAEGPAFSDLERAAVLVRLAACRYALASVQTAAALLDEAMALALRSGLPCERLQADILAWRSRCRRRRRDHAGARDDVREALALAAAPGDRRAAAAAAIDASLVAERRGHAGLARAYALQARARLEEVAEERALARLALDLGGLRSLLGEHEQAIGDLTRSLTLAHGAGAEADAAKAHAGLAAVHLDRGDLVEAAEHAGRALALVAGRDDLLLEAARAQLLLGRAFLEQGRLEEAEECFRAADVAFEQDASGAGNRADAWVALGDLATRRGDDRAAARLYRRAADALRDVRF